MGRRDVRPLVARGTAPTFSDECGKAVRASGDRRRIAATAPAGPRVESTAGLRSVRAAATGLLRATGQLCARARGAASADAAAHPGALPSAPLAAPWHRQARRAGRVLGRATR